MTRSARGGRRWGSPPYALPPQHTHSARFDPCWGVWQVNYVYIPEGNKTHSLYWTTELWIPALHQRGTEDPRDLALTLTLTLLGGLCPDFEYLVMIDDDVPLPENFDFQEEL